ncbi:SMI1/KNR4 family protein [Providencia rettgeri]|uniref:SMI1/KNR4 family protein n=2 Tax=Providencia TaxID=586 RepID=A0AAP2NXA7_PRORE|nr:MULTISPECIES: SMI1/KNR4 family protein [Providencia]ELR5132270.1 SMI1/KNR4 family protein [Providencia rettgeri]ELR5198306.1 SMI1/KNR4 family protein [Providencia rettgeri]ELR5228000.1 SMI1/KNR4 family protein [Providencia rettgeri]ELR5239456.1 SMI1/KNR4 family protein [Providencia rettgeri]ELR5251733.1 SMI1/KNR4 family protein [Providencia rettgeri]
MSCYIYSLDELPKGFKFPRTFLEIINQEVILDLDPWWFLCEFEKFAKYWLLEMKNQYPTRKLIPFAKLSYSDDIVCFDGDDTSGDPKVFYVHAFASAGWEDRGYTDNFTEWLKIARLESARYKAEQANDE